MVGIKVINYLTLLSAAVTYIAADLIFLCVEKGTEWLQWHGYP